jgi:hypothetical protein
MRHRTFTDRSGVCWTVSEVTKDIPTSIDNRERRTEPRSMKRRFTESTRLATRPHDLPWLSFESPNTRRRISSVPIGWDDLPEDQLEDLLGKSEMV